MPSEPPAAFPEDPDESPKSPTKEFGATVHTAGRAVPLEDYSANINKMIESFLEPTSELYLPGVRIALMTPPPVVVSMRKPENAKVELDHTRKYKDACLSIGKEWLGKSEGRVQIIDCWKTLIEAAGGEEDDLLRPFFVDGVHLTPKAYRSIFDELMRVIKEQWQHLDPANIIPAVPRYNAATDNWEWNYEPRVLQDARSETAIIPELV